ncbi:MAG TPA: SEC-C metal-binding domain-containing protein [Casimicrobiaceae bacterium]|nr:SEC-C metal-binding domain-containing protein [Casimicrobiaceae bacterium]
MSGDPAPVSRNAPCPCGSAKRYKDCHGAIAAPPLVEPSRAFATAAAPSAYLPSGPDWDHLPQAQRVACGLLMRRALERQRAGKLVAAAALYQEVLSRAPNTHDALHMLGAIELQRGNLAQSKEWMLAALKLRALYPEIERNLQMVDKLERAARLERAATALSEDLCEKALPGLVDLALRPGPRPRSGPSPSRDRKRRSERAVHLIAGVRDSGDDGAWMVRRLATLLASSGCVVWADRHARLPLASARRLVPEIGDFPDGGCHVFVGVDVDCGEWLDRAEADRVIVLCQPAAPSQLLEQLRAIARDGARPLELVFPSRAMAARFGAGHAVLPPPVAADAELIGDERGRGSSSPRSFALGLVGTHWQGNPSGDAAFLQQLASASPSMEIYDPGALRYLVGAKASVRCRNRGAAAMRAFVQSVDCILHVDGPWWLEGDGRELFLAMASGVPIVCPRASLFAEYVDHGVDGLLYDDRDQALEYLAALRESPSRCAELGRATRAKIGALLAPERVASFAARLVPPEPAALPRGAGVARELIAAK